MPQDMPCCPDKPWTWHLLSLLQLEGDVSLQMASDTHNMMALPPRHKKQTTMLLTMSTDRSICTARLHHHSTLSWRRTDPRKLQNKVFSDAPGRCYHRLQLSVMQCNYADGFAPVPCATAALSSPGGSHRVRGDLKQWLVIRLAGSTLADVACFQTEVRHGRGHRRRSRLTARHCAIGVTICRQRGTAVRQGRGPAGTYGQVSKQNTTTERCCG